VCLLVEVKHVARGSIFLCFADELGKLRRQGAKFFESPEVMQATPGEYARSSIGCLFSL